MLEYDLVKEDFFYFGERTSTDLRTWGERYFWSSQSEHLPNKTDMGRDLSWVNGDRKKQLREILERRFPVYVNWDVNKDRNLTDYFTDKNTLKFKHPHIANLRAVWNSPFEQTGYRKESDFFFIGELTKEQYPRFKAATNLRYGVNRDCYGAHQIGIADDGTVYNCKVAFHDYNHAQERLVASWGTIRVCVVSFW